MKLYRHLTCTLQFVDAVWYAVMADESLIRHIVADESVVLLSVSYPFRLGSSGTKSLSAVQGR